ncbi:MAG: MFS transporter [Spirochaetia bacterium]
MSSERTERAYDFLFGGEEGRACETIPESACKEVPGNALKNIASGVFSKLAEQLAHPGLTLPWLLSSFGVPSAVSSLLLPLKEVGSLAPQLFVAAHVRATERRNRLWFRAALFQALVLVGVAVSLLVLPPVAAGVVAAALFLVFGISSGVGSLSFKDTLAKTIPKPRRGTLLGLRASLGGAVALVAGGILAVVGGAQAGTATFLAFVLGGALLWVISGLFFLSIVEEPGATAGGRNPFDSVREAFALLRGAANVRRFIFARSLNVSIALVQPVYVLITAERLGFSFSGLGTLLIASAGAALVSGWVWGRITDRSARFSLIVGPLFGVAVGALFFLLPLIGGLAAGAVGHGVVLFLHNIAHAGARIGRKTYLVNATRDLDRAMLSAAANTTIGVATLAISGLVSLVTGTVGMAAAAVMLIGFLCVGGLFAFRLDEV